MIWKSGGRRSMQGWSRFHLTVGLATALMVGLALAAASATARAGSGATVTTRAAKPAVKIASTLDGPLLVNKSGYTIYMFVRDKRREDKCRKIKGCEKDWPPVTVDGKLVGGPGVKKSLLGTIPYKGKLREVTYAGWPLHTYRFDTSKASVMNIGIVQFGGAWYGLNASGGEVR